MLRGLAVVIVGVVLGAIATVVLSSQSAEIRWLLGAVGVSVIAVGARRTVDSLFGRRVEIWLWASVGWLVILTMSAVLADLLPLAEARDTSLTISTDRLLRPSLFSAHPLGTDRHGLDILGGVIYGARVSLVVGIGAVALGLVVGGSVGMAAGFYRGRLEAVTNFTSDSILAFPPLVLLLGLVAVLEPSVRNVTLGLAVVGVPIYFRLARANTMALARRDFVLSARVLGARNRRLLVREILPNVLPTLASYGFVVIAVLIVAESSLSYLGLSVRRPNPTWGNMIAAGESAFDVHPHLVLAPGFVLFLTVLALNRVGEAVRSVWDPRLR